MRMAWGWSLACEGGVGVDLGRPWVGAVRGCVGECGDREAEDLVQAQRKCTARCSRDIGW